MNNRTTIQKELLELNSPLAFEKPVETYSVPAGYFENFAASVLQKLHGQNSLSVNDEVESLSPLLAGISKEMPFTLPQGYFDSSTDGITSWVKEEEQQLFTGNKKMPYEVPAGYFESLPGIVLKKANPQKAKVISITSTRRWMRVAVAALVAGVIAVSSVLYFGKDKSVDPVSDSYSWVEKNLKNIPDKELDEFLNTTYISTPALAKNGSSNKVEVRKLLKDIPNAELDKFLEEISIDTEDASLFN
jgi:hypothetical protein